jgi:nicotinamide mononucleotide transporter
MSVTEILGFVSGAACVWLYVRQNLWAWPVGLANSGLWLVLFWTQRLYLDAGLQLVYIGLGIAGWYWWLRGGDRPGELPVRRTRPREAAFLVGIGVAATAALAVAMRAVSDAQPLPDAATTVVSLIAQYMLTRKMIGTWWCWIAVDVAYVVLYSRQHLYLTAALQPLFIAMCVAGLRQWRRAMRERVAVPVVPGEAAVPAVAGEPSGAVPA